MRKTKNLNVEKAIEKGSVTKKAISAHLTRRLNGLENGYVYIDTVLKYAFRCAMEFDGILKNLDREWRYLVDHFSRAHKKYPQRVWKVIIKLVNDRELFNFGK